MIWNVRNFKDFDVGVIYPLRTYERHQFRFSIDGREYKGDYQDETINWLNPSPRHFIEKGQLDKIETRVQQMLKDFGVRDDDIEDIVIGRMLNKAHFSTDAHRFKLKTRGEEFTGVHRDDNIDWFHPKPQGKLSWHEIHDLEKKVHKKVKEYTGWGAI